MKKIILVRHAKSSWKDPSLRDIERPLNKRGQRDAPYMATWFSKTQAHPDHLITSPAKRARITAKHFKQALDMKGNQISVEDRLYMASPMDILKIIQHLPPAYKTVALFGHNPGFTEFANWFSKQYIDNVPTCGIVQIQVGVTDWNNLTPGSGELTSFVFPKKFLP